jgi:small subunit ribosomal protein S6
MTKYEMLYIISTKVEDEAKDAIIAKFESIVTAAGGTVESIDKWGVKKLAYAINYQTEGYYVLMTFECETSVIAEITRVAGITEGMLRQMVTKRVK